MDCCGTEGAGDDAEGPEIERRRAKGHGTCGTGYDGSAGAALHLEAAERAGWMGRREAGADPAGEDTLWKGPVYGPRTDDGTGKGRAVERRICQMQDPRLCAQAWILRPASSRWGRHARTQRRSACWLGNARSAVGTEMTWSGR